VRAPRAAGALLLLAERVLLRQLAAALAPRGVFV
jgi:hypothetical protein